jgi:uncharacterized protein
VGQRIRLLPEKMAILRCEPGTAVAIPPVGFFSLIRTADELSVIVEQSQAPKHAQKKSTGWRLFQVEGPFELDVIGVLASITAPLAEAKVSIFALATYDTDYFLISGRQTLKAIRALRAAGHTVIDASAG